MAKATRGVQVGCADLDETVTVLRWESDRFSATEGFQWACTCGLHGVLMEHEEDAVEQAHDHLAQHRRLVVLTVYCTGITAPRAMEALRRVRPGVRVVEGASDTTVIGLTEPGG